MKLTTIKGDGTTSLGVTTDQVTAFFIPNDIGTASITIIAIGEKGEEYTIPDGDIINKPGALFTGKNVKVAAVITGFSKEFDIELGQ